MVAFGGVTRTKTQVKPVPEGYHTATPVLTVNNGAAALGIYARTRAAPPRGSR